MADTPAFQQLGTILYREQLATTHVGRVYRGYDRDDGQPVEVKIGDPRCAELRADPALLARLAHPGIVRIRDAAIIDGDTPVLVQDQPAGKCVADVWPQFDGMYRQIAHFIRETGVILDHAHELGITHGDLSPRTVRLGDDDLPRIAEFGMGMITPASRRVADAQQDAGSDPAAIRERKFKLDERADVFALGAVLYFLLSGETATDQPLALLSDPDAPHDDIPPIDRVAPEAPTELRAICAQALATDPVHRYLHVRTMVRDLETYLHGKHRKPVVGVALAVVGALLVVLFGIWGTVGGGPARIVDVQITALHPGDAPSNAFALANADQALDVNDGFRVRAQLSKPAYISVFFRDPSGQVHTLAEPDATQQPARAIDCPSGDGSSKAWLHVSQGGGHGLLIIVSHSKRDWPGDVVAGVLAGVPDPPRSYAAIAWYGANLSGLTVPDVLPPRPDDRRRTRDSWPDYAGRITRALQAHGDDAVIGLMYIVGG